MWLLTLRGKLCLSPKEKTAKRVLDVGTGTGIWAIEYVDDLEKDWTWSSPFDFIFARVLSGSFQNYEDFIKKSFANLEPGGYLELQEVHVPYESDDGSLPKDSELAKMGIYFRDAANMAGRPMDMSPKLEGWMKDAGFVNVVVHMFKWPLNNWPRDPHYKELGSWCFTNIDDNLEGLTMAMFTRILGWTKDETVLFCSRVRKQLRDRRIHAYCPVYVLYGQKPE
ncbi:hypothetical protein ACHAQH_003050 [Verticillium albo-atrum]